MLKPIAHFITYQMDPRYLRLYDFDPADIERPSELFDLFVAWQKQEPRLNYQVGIFDRQTSALLGCGGLRMTQADTAVLGIELAPTEWGRFRVALDVAGALLEHGFTSLQLDHIVGDTASGNKRIEKLAKWFGAEIVARRAGPSWMQTRGWEKVDWALTRQGWARSPRRFQVNKAAYRTPSDSP